MITESRPNIEIDFTDDKLTGSAGLVFVSALARQFGLMARLCENVTLKKRQRACSDHQLLMSLIYSFCCGNGHLSDRDALSCDPTARRWLGIDQRPDSRRLGEYLSRFNQVGMDGLLRVARDVCRQTVPAVIDEHLARLGYVPVFMDEPGIEV